MKKLILISDYQLKISCPADFELQRMEIRDRQPKRAAARASEIVRELDVIAISIEGLFKGCRRQDQGGAEVLKWLRCKHRVTNPIILFSFQSNAALLKQKPENLIINSPGCYHYQFPMGIEDLLRQGTLKGVQGNLEEQIRPHLRTAFNLEAFRHKEANWWGMKCMWDAHCLSRPNYGKNHFGRYPARVQEEMNSVDAWIAQILFGNSKESLSGYFDAKRKPPVNPYTTEHAFLSAHQEDFRMQVILMQNQLAMTHEELDTIPVKSDTKAERASIQAEIINLERGISEYGDELLKIQKLLANLERSPIPSPSMTGIEEETLQDIGDFLDIRDMQEELKHEELKILHIDDESGWSEIFSKVLIPQKSKRDSNFKSADVSDLKKLSVNNDIEILDRWLDNEISLLIAEFKPNLVLLDLIIAPHYDGIMGTKKTCGARTLNYLKKHNPGIPVIVTTASNRVSNFIELESIGADGYWIKEGIDSKYNAQETVDNYFQFIRLISRATSPEMQNLHSLGLVIKNLASSDNLWWTSAEWSREVIVGEVAVVPSSTSIAKEGVFEILEDAYAMLRAYLRVRVMGYGWDVYSGKEWFIQSQVVQHLGKILELVHQVDIIQMNCEVSGIKVNDRYKYIGSSLMNIRSDWDGIKMFRRRSDASHYNKAKNLPSDFMWVYFRDMLTYLCTPPKAINTFNVNPQS
jgi:DNA-binding NarL/FixJ family response regulator